MKISAVVFCLIISSIDRKQQENILYGSETSINISSEDYFNS